MDRLRKELHLNHDPETFRAPPSSSSSSSSSRPGSSSSSSSSSGAGYPLRRVKPQPPGAGGSTSGTPSASSQSLGIHLAPRSGPHPQSTGQSFGIHRATHGRPYLQLAGQSCGIHQPAQGTPKNQARGQRTRHMIDILRTRHWPREYWVARQPFEAHLATQPRSKLTIRCRRPPTASQTRTGSGSRAPPAAGPPAAQRWATATNVDSAPASRRGHSTGRQPRFARRLLQPPMQRSARPCCSLR